LAKQIHSNTLAECLGLIQTDNSKLSKHAIKFRSLTLKTPCRVGVVAFERKLVAKKNEDKLELKIHMKWREVLQ